MVTDYVELTVTPEPTPVWELVDWKDGPTLPGGWDADPLAGALPTVEMEGRADHDDA